ncbi:2,4-dienoyl-CoA reductase-like NADH-dependent reductase (Old Yellow Enzyme family) [Mycolicibacterium sp. BK556]|uniref:oxidoreductase n=1 Tax=Mycobacteriaceae TaxID=1762 RepID=UPI00105FCB06|nr:MULTISPECIES: 12-oxophytodienoate reductase [Mycobacteriaceae]MBB3606698.1 2,4-dienoyl-CoA reductase-like NADH-dependent reductase (Old Yellow Enzyme family) [Mycolicibacterium sp. BK556]MBB3636636.1 2,4-dienoyl-CoA reductase-like NADH-dependent reductase (Old Yellow Enzyme family) [Mycolicibacterium sp. BK607]MBB3754278.1 2,4-dienoyl-CoA reductase-like NADH-dependent reductase (Old Yellow Enzyme family) [Mycolicibacterium sp. BK634]TDO17080.1 2,4-dienoyl-CoA reductase-like NADH-dependent re
MDDARVSDLFTPLTVGSLTVRNRFAMAPMTRAASPGGIPGPDVAAYYARRAAGGTGLVITEGIRIPHPAAGWPDRIPNLDGDEVLAGWRAVTEAVHAEGGTIAAQLWHQGAARGVHDGDAPDQVPVSPSGIDLAGSAIGRALSIDELPELADAYALAASNAKAAGFDAVEIHGAHGYLLDQFLWEQTNQRTDGYGGSLAGRTRFPAEVVAAVRAAVGPDFPIIFRFSQWKMNRYDARIAASGAELGELLAPLVEAGVDVLHPSTRRHYLPGFEDEDPRLSLAGWTKKVTGLPVIAVGSVGLETEFNPGEGGGPIPPSSIDTLLDQFDAGEFDIVAVGRALLADPAWVNRVRDGTLDEFGGFDAPAALGSLY